MFDADLLGNVRVIMNQKIIVRKESYNRVLVREDKGELGKVGGG